VDGRTILTLLVQLTSKEGRDMVLNSGMESACSSRWASWSRSRSPFGEPGSVPSLRPQRPEVEDRSGLSWRLAMALRIVCMCGYVIQGDDDDELWMNAQGHMGVLHPELVGNVTRDDILAQAEQL
jgi:hypothetical protein